MNHISKKIIGLGAAAAVALSSTAALAETADSALIKGGKLNLRETPSLSAKVLGQFPTGTLVEIIEHGDEWHQVEVNGKEGYMMAKFLNTGENEQTATVRTNSGIGLNLREEPATSGKIITSVRNGGQVTVIQKGIDWSRVSVDGQEGFMSTKYLTFGSKPAAPSTGKTAVVTGCEKLRGNRVFAHDLRAGAALVIAGLVAEGTTQVENIHFIERGYENLVEKLTALGADIQRVEA